jgi:catechol 2,3-dioxygenase-like lactoylglutathione lyase family enzyme
MTFRVARHTNNLEAIKAFYITILGFQELGSFINHEEYDGIFIGQPNENWHLEFTQSNEIALHTFDEDDILVFYPTSEIEYDAIVNRIKAHQLTFIKAKNPYWNTTEKCCLILMDIGLLFQI